MAWPINIPPELSSIWKQIEQGNIEQALSGLLNFSRGRDWDCYKEMIIYKYRLSELKKMERKGTIQFNDYQIASSQLIDGFIESLKEVSSTYTNNLLT